jgi:hypothetical protein
MAMQDPYVWLVLVAALDIMLTWVILHFGGREVNGVAAHIITHYGLPGLVAFKFAIVAFVILLCEVIHRRRPSAARRLARWAIAINCVPIALAFWLLLHHA